MTKGTQKNSKELLEKDCSYAPNRSDWEKIETGLGGTGLLNEF